MAGQRRTGFGPLNDPGVGEQSARSSVARRSADRPCSGMRCLSGQGAPLSEPAGRDRQWPSVVVRRQRRQACLAPHSTRSNFACDTEKLSLFVATSRWHLNVPARRSLAGYPPARARITRAHARVTCARHARAHTRDACARGRTRMRTRARARARTCAHAHTHAHTRTWAHARGRMRTRGRALRLSPPPGDTDAAGARA